MAYKEANCSAMVQIVARRLCQLHNSDPDRMVPGEIGTYEGVAGAVLAVKRVVGTKVTEPHPLWLHFVADARTAVEAMREPSAAMLDAGKPWTHNNTLPPNCYMKMIDAALAEMPSTVQYRRSSGTDPQTCRP